GKSSCFWSTSLKVVRAGRSLQRAGHTGKKIVQDSSRLTMSAKHSQAFQPTQISGQKEVWMVPEGHAALKGLSSIPHLTSVAARRPAGFSIEVTKSYYYFLTFFRFGIPYFYGKFYFFLSLPAADHPAGSAGTTMVGRVEQAPSWPLQPASPGWWPGGPLRRPWHLFIYPHKTPNKMLRPYE
ncbi:hypothetical protein THAOC_04809, partial [Thalassiosira oceanica]